MAQESCDLDSFERFQQDEPDWGDDPDAAEAAKIEAEAMQQAMFMQVEPCKRHLMKKAKQKNKRKGSKKHKAKHCTPKKLTIITNPSYYSESAPLPTLLQSDPKIN